MKNLIAISLSLLLTLSSIACVCVASASPADDGHAGHHQTSTVDSDSGDCPRQDCDSDCTDSYTRTLDRDGLVKSGLKVEQDEDLDVGSDSTALSYLRVSLATAQPPPPRWYPIAPTPVQRKDKLLE